MACDEVAARALRLPTVAPGLNLLHQEAMDAFFHMGGYGAYVWSAYAASAFGLGGLALFIWNRGKRLAQRLKALEREREGGRSPDAGQPSDPPAQ